MGSIACSTPVGVGGGGLSNGQSMSQASPFTSPVAKSQNHADQVVPLDSLFWDVHSHFTTSWRSGAMFLAAERFYPSKTGC